MEIVAEIWWKLTCEGQMELIDQGKDDEKKLLVHGEDAENYAVRKDGNPRSWLGFREEEDDEAISTFPSLVLE